MRPLMFAALANRRADAVTGGDGKGPFLFWTTRGEIGGAIAKQLNGYPARRLHAGQPDVSEGVGDETYVLLGNLRWIIIGRVAGIELAVSEHAYFGADQVALRVITRMDIAVSRPESIVVCPTLKVA